jgi:hypothetical protein
MASGCSNNLRNISPARQKVKTHSKLMTPIIQNFDSFLVNYLIQKWH